MNKTILTTLFAFLLVPLVSYAQDAKMKVAFDIRTDFSSTEAVALKDAKRESDFQISYLNLHVSGDINKHWSYSWRQRLNKFRNLGDDMFSSTDWLHFTYKPTTNWAISAGKQVVAIGGYEYDQAPINIYYASMFWNNIACYQFGASASYTTNSGNHTVTLQACNSPFQKIGNHCYAYNAMWVGKVGCWSTLWSFNLMEYVPGRYAEYIALGNKVSLGRFTLDVDLMNRHYNGCGHRFLFDDWSLMAKAEYRVCDYLNVFACGGYEYYRPSAASDQIKQPYYGAGVEVFPIKKCRDLRIHAAWNTTHNHWDDNDTFDGAEMQQFKVGITWRCNVFTLK